MTENYYKQEDKSVISYDLNDSLNSNNQSNLLDENNTSFKGDKNNDSAVINLLQNQNILKRKKFLKLVLKTYSIEDTEKIISYLQEILKNKIDEKRELSIKAIKQDVQILKLLETIKSENIDIDTLKTMFKDKGIKGIDSMLNKFKYQYKDETGLVHYWSGKGRVPLPISTAIQNGKTKDDFLRSNQDNITKLSNEGK